MLANIVYKNNLKKISNENLVYHNYIYCHKCVNSQEIEEINYNPTDPENKIEISSYYTTCSSCKSNWNAILIKKCSQCEKSNVFYTRRNMFTSGCACVCDYRCWK